MHSYCKGLVITNLQEKQKSLSMIVLQSLSTKAILIMLLLLAILSLCKQMIVREQVFTVHKATS